MIVMGAQPSGVTNRFHAMSVSEAMKRTAPVAASGFPEARALATMTAMTAMYAETNDVSDVSEEERDESGQEPVDHEEYVARQRSDERGYEGPALSVAARI